jgi:hypothetical protein
MDIISTYIVFQTSVSPFWHIFAPLISVPCQMTDTHMQTHTHSLEHMDIITRSVCVAIYHRPVRRVIKKSSLNLLVCGHPRSPIFVFSFAALTNNDGQATKKKTHTHHTLTHTHGKSYMVYHYLFLFIY